MPNLFKKKPYGDQICTELVIQIVRP